MTQKEKDELCPMIDIPVSVQRADKEAWAELTEKNRELNEALKYYRQSQAEDQRFIGSLQAENEQEYQRAEALKLEIVKLRMVSWKDTAADALTEIGRLDQMCQRYRTALQRISRGELAVPGLKPGYYGHASAIAEVALGGVAKEKT